MGTRELETLVAAARAELDDPARTRVVGGSGAEPPRFELFHAAEGALGARGKGHPLYLSRAGDRGQQGIYTDDIH